MARRAYLAAYAALAALGAALLARPALLWLRGLGLLRPVLPWQVFLGGAAALLASLLCALAVFLAVRAALGRKLLLPQHAAFLLLVAAALALRSAAGDPRPPPDPEPQLREGLRTAAGVLDAEYAGSARYAPSAALLQGALFALPRPGFVYRGRELPLSARVLHGMTAAQLKALPGDLPGTVYVAISRDEQRAWLSVLSLDGVLPATVQAHAGTHSLPGGDPLLPAYPGMRTAPR
jgi:hypothetical protein